LGLCGEKEGGVGGEGGGVGVVDGAEIDVLPEVAEFLFAGEVG